MLKENFALDIKEYLFIFLMQPKRYYLERLLIMLIDFYNNYSCEKFEVSLITKYFERESLQ